MTNNSDIISINNDIIQMFNTHENNLERYEHKLEEYEVLLSKNISYRVRKRISDHWESLKSLIQDIKTQQSKNFYLLETTPILEKYRKILNKPIEISFMGRQIKPCNDIDRLVNEFIDIAKRYKNEIKYNTKNQTNTKTLCDNCNNRKSFETLENELICLDCGNTIPLNENLSSYKDVTRVNMTAKYIYDKKIHFRDCINQYQGKQNVTIPNIVYQNLEEQFLLHGLIDTSKQGKDRFFNITKQHVHMFLKETGHAKHYENYLLIYNKLTGKPLPDISDIEQQILDDFDKLTALYDKKYKKQGIERKSFINTQYVLYQLLRRHKFSCKRDDFNILKTVDRKSFHDDICRDLFETLNWNFTALF